MNGTIWAVIITASLGLVGSLAAVRQARAAEADKVIVARNTNEIEMTKVQIDGWHRFVESYRVENERLNAAVKEERAIAESFAAKADRLAEENRQLQAEVVYCRTNHHPGGNAP